MSDRTISETLLNDYIKDASEVGICKCVIPLNNNDLLIPAYMNMKYGKAIGGRESHLVTVPYISGTHLLGVSWLLYVDVLNR